MKRAILASLAAVLLAGGTYIGGVLIAADRAANAPIIPDCAEDVVLVGRGDFENGRWSEYECGPAVDDYEVDV